MDHRFKGLILALSLSASSVFAGYAQAVPPAGWGPAPAGSGMSGGFTGTAANGASFSAGSVNTRATMNFGGRAASIPASMRFAANAPRYAATALMMHPTLRGVATIAGWLAMAGLAYDLASEAWVSTDVPPDNLQSTGFMWANGAGGQFGTLSFTYLEAARKLAAYYNRELDGCVVSSATSYTCRIVGRIGTLEVWQVSTPSTCPSGWYVTPAGCVQSPQPKTFTQDEAIEELTRHPMPPDVPQYIPEPLPVEVPYIEPTFIPTSDPVPNPNYDPSSPVSPSNPPQHQPGVEVRGAPSPSSPWSVSIIPRNAPVTDPTATPGRDPRPVSSTPPTGGGTSAPAAPELGFCEANPNVLACQTLEHENDSTKLPTKEVDFSFNPIPGFQGAKSCPAFPNVGSILGGTQISWQPFCDSLAKVSNLLLSFAWASAAFIILGYGRGD